jgi:hypothetical protein
MATAAIPGIAAIDVCSSTLGIAMALAGGIRLRRWFPSLIRVRPFSRANREWWAGIAEALLSSALLLIGVVLLVLSLTFAVLFSTPNELYISVGKFSLQLVVAIVLISIGIYCIIALLWKVGVSAERRGAIVSKAGEIEILNEFRQRREDLPTIPLNRHPPKVGKRLGFKLVPSARNVWRLITAAISSVGFVALATVLVSLSVAAFDRQQADWLATGLAIPITLAALLSIFLFFRQLLMLTGIGATQLEISAYPLQPGRTFRVFLSQTSQVRIQRLDIHLICQEEATFIQGTDVRTERATVLDERLFRGRGIYGRSPNPYETEFDLEISPHAMHSFKSPNNRIKWNIVVTVQARNWPRLKRKFDIAVHPLTYESHRASQP